MIKLKVAKKKHGFTLSLENAYLEKPLGGRAIFTQVISPNN